MQQVRKLIFFVNEDEYFLSHRLNLAKAAQKAGFQVAVATGFTSEGAKEAILREGIEFFELPFRRKSVNPLNEFIMWFKAVSILQQFEPTHLHNIALKAILSGTISGIFYRILGRRNLRIFNTFTGLGFVFTSASLFALLIRTVLSLVFRFLLRHPAVHNVFQNPDDLDYFQKHNLVDARRLTLIRGSGVDTEKFKDTPELQNKLARIIVPARLLREKGILEAVEASRILKAKNLPYEMILLGKIDPLNPGAFTENEVRGWENDGVVKWQGHSKDMPSEIQKSHIVCLPSYREGVPLALIEAASSARPLVTTDVPGCREICRDGMNGVLVPAKSSVELANALELLIQNQELRQKMGKKGRELTLAHFSKEKVNEAQINLYENV